MPFDGSAVDITIPAGSDLSNYQYRFVTVDTSGYATVCAAKGLPIGILQNKPGAAGRAARIRIAGISLMYHGAANAGATLLGVGVYGDGTATTTDAYGAIALVGVGNSADINSVLIQKGYC